MKIVSQCHDRPCGARARDDCQIARCAIHSEQYDVDELRAAAQLLDYEAQKAQKAISVSRAQFTVKMMAEEDELRVLKKRRNSLYRAANLKEAAVRFYLFNKTLIYLSISVKSLIRATFTT